MQTKVVEVYLMDDGEAVITEELLVLGDKATISSARILRDSGEMIAPVTIARTGIMHYKASELGDLFKDRDPNSIVRVRTKPEVLFDQATIDSCRSLPVTIGHPDKDVDLSNNKELQKGFLEGTPIADGSMLAGHLVLNDSSAIRLVDSGVDQISLGHKSILVRCDGDPEADCDKTTIRGNHIAIVRRGRAQTTRIGDSGEEIEIVDRASFDAVEAERDVAKAKIAELEAKLSDEMAARLTDEAVQTMVQERVESRMNLLVEVAKLGDEFTKMDFAGKTDAEVRRLVVEKLLDEDFSAKSDDYIQAAFDMSLKDAGETTLSDALSASLQKPEKTERKPSVRDEALARRNARYNK